MEYGGEHYQNDTRYDNRDPGLNDIVLVGRIGPLAWRREDAHGLEVGIMRVVAGYAGLMLCGSIGSIPRAIMIIVFDTIIAVDYARITPLAGKRHITVSPDQIALIYIGMTLRTKLVDLEQTRLVANTRNSY